MQIDTMELAQMRGGDIVACLADFIDELARELWEVRGRHPEDVLSPIAVLLAHQVDAVIYWEKEHDEYT